MKSVTQSNKLAKKNQAEKGEEAVALTSQGVSSKKSVIESKSKKSPKEDKAPSEPADKIVAVAKPSTAKSSSKQAAAKGAKKAPAKKK